MRPTRGLLAARALIKLQTGRTHQVGAAAAYYLTGYHRERAGKGRQPDVQLGERAELAPGRCCYSSLCT